MTDIFHLFSSNLHDINYISMLISDKQYIFNIVHNRSLRRHMKNNLLVLELLFFSIDGNILSVYNQNGVTHFKTNIDNSYVIQDEFEYSNLANCEQFHFTTSDIEDLYIGNHRN